MKWTTCIVIVLTGVTLLCTCRARKPQAQLRTDALDGRMLDREGWLEKAATTLRNGSSVDPLSGLGPLLAMTDDQALESLMQDPRFAQTVLRFNLFFFGRAIPSVFSPGRVGGSTTSFVDSDGPVFLADAEFIPVDYHPTILEFPSAVASAWAVQSDQDYFRLFDPEPNFFAVWSLNPSFGEARARLLTEIPRLSAGVYGFETGEWCEKAQDILEVAEQPFSALTFSSKGSSGRNLIRTSLAEPIAACSAPTAPTTEQQLALRRSVGAILERFNRYADQLNPNTAAHPGFPGLVRLPDELSPTGARSEVSERPNIFSRAGLWAQLNNSSTNFNRKRSAWALRTFFCEDMVPVDLPPTIPVSTSASSSTTTSDMRSSAMSATHARTRHASERGCMACHYKLDPMGGLFRLQMQGGSRFEEGGTFTFDDGKTITEGALAAYFADWQHPTTGALRVGYYTDVDRPHPNWRGETLEDLLNFARTSIETKRCLVRRMGEYFVSRNQMLDPAWIASLADQLQSGPNSGASFKRVLAQVIKSNAFKQINPDAQTCYDSGVEPARGSAPLPCNVRYVLETNCLSCHRNIRNNLDLSRFDGAWFPHVSAPNVPRTKRASIDEIVRRLSLAVNHDDHMPPRRDMPLLERDLLLQWLRQERTQ